MRSSREVRKTDADIRTSAQPPIRLLVLCLFPTHCRNDRSGRAEHQQHSCAGDGRGGAGTIRTPGTPDGARARGLCALDPPLSATIPPRQTGSIAIASCSPAVTSMLVYAMLTFPGTTSPSTTSYPAVGLEDARSPRARPYRRGRDHDRSPEAGFGNSVGMAMAEKLLAAEFNRTGMSW